MLCNSWIISDRTTGKVVFETFSEAKASQVNQDRYAVHTAHEWLASLNKRIKTES